MLNDQMILHNELERMWKVAVVTHFWVLSYHFLRGTEKKHVRIVIVLAKI
jgi:predicted Ser/Thr protein kinase